MPPGSTTRANQKVNAATLPLPDHIAHEDTIRTTGPNPGNDRWPHTPRTHIGARKAVEDGAQLIPSGKMAPEAATAKAR